MSIQDEKIVYFVQTASTADGPFFPRNNSQFCDRRSIGQDITFDETNPKLARGARITRDDKRHGLMNLSSVAAFTTAAAATEYAMALAENGTWSIPARSAQELHVRVVQHRKVVEESVIGQYVSLKAQPE